MRRLALLGVGVGMAMAASCTVGPKYEPVPVIAATERIGVPQLSDSSRHFFDSLAVERARDSVPAQAGMPNAVRPTLNAATVSAAAWLDIIRTRRSYRSLTSHCDRIAISASRSRA